MASIGANNFFALHGVVQKPHQRVVDQSQPFADGVCLAKIGKTAPISELQGFADVGNVATAVGVCQGYDAMVGQIYTVTNYGVAVPYVFVHAVRHRILGGDNGVGVGGLNNGPVLIESQWQVQYVAPA